MRLVLKIFKWLGWAIGVLLLLLVVAGGIYRLLGPAPHPPPGELVDIGEIKLHIDSEGPNNEYPTVVIEAGLGMGSTFYHWLNEGLKDSMRVIRYDRAGIGYSEAGNTPRDPETVARELHLLLEKTGETPPYIMIGHSFGGPYLRVFTQLYPDEVSALIFLDPTHPEQVARLGAPEPSSLRFKSLVWGTGAGAVLGDLGILGLFDRLNGPLLNMEGLPDDINQRMSDFLLTGKNMRAYHREIKQYHAGLERSAQADNFGALPIRVFTAVERIPTAGQPSPPDQAETIAAQREFTELSTDGKQILITSNHSSIFTIRAHAEVICGEVSALVSSGLVSNK